jgi:uncharacterized membrane protein YoaK (UPF0700 family)
MITRLAPYRLLLPAAMLCLAAGYVDAVGYLGLGHVFAANMTGNTVLLAIAAVRGDVDHVAIYLATLIFFFLGAVVAALFKRLSLTYLPLLLGAALLLAAPQASAAHLPTLLLLAASMGLQGGSLSTFGRTTLHTVVVTGTMMKLADGLIERFWPDTSPHPAGEALPLLSIAWLAYCAGAAIGTVANDHFSRTLLPPAILMLLTAGDLYLTGRRKPSAAA